MKKEVNKLYRSLELDLDGAFFAYYVAFKFLLSIVCLFSEEL